MLIFVMRLLLCKKWLFSLQILWHLMLLLFFFISYHKISAEQIYSICCSVTDQLLWNVLKGLERTFLINKHCQTIPLLKVFCCGLFVWCIFEWFGNVSSKWTEVSAQHTIDCRVPDIHHCHVEPLSLTFTSPLKPTPSKKEPKWSH